MIDTNFEPKDFLPNHLGKYDSSDLIKHRQACQTFISKTYDIENDGIERLKSQIRRSYTNVENSQKKLISMKNSAKENILFIDKYLSSVFEIEEQRKSKRKQRKKKKTLEEKRQDLLKELQNIDEQLEGGG